MKMEAMHDIKDVVLIQAEIKRITKNYDGTVSYTVEPINCEPEYDSYYDRSTGLYEISESILKEVNNVSE